MDDQEGKPLKNAPTEKKKTTFKEKIECFRENITVEPTMAFYVVAGALSRLAIQNLNLDKACRVNLEFGEAICDSLIERKGFNDYQAHEEAIQSLVSLMETWKHVLLTALPSLLLLFIGGWSDKTGNRKICILLPIIGDFLMSLSNLLNTYFFYEIPVQVTMLMEGIFPAMTGGWVVNYVGAFSYICDVSSEESRTFRIGILQVCLSAASPVGLALSGVLLKSIGYYGVFSITALLNLCSIYYGFVYLKDPERAENKGVSEDQTKGMLNSVKLFFDVKHVKDTLGVAFKKGPNQRRKKSILIFLAVFFLNGPCHCEFVLRYLFTRLRFHWDAVIYSYYSTAFVVLHTIGGMISISLFSRKLQWDDSCLGIISLSAKIIGNLGTGFAKTTRQMFLALIPETINANALTALRSISSKLVPSSELGKIIAFFNLTEVVTQMIFGPAYSIIYKNSLESNNEGFIFFLTIGFLTIPMTIFIWFFWNSLQHKKDRPKEDEIKKLNDYLKCYELIEQNSADNKTTSE